MNEKNVDNKSDAITNISKNSPKKQEDHDEIKETRCLNVYNKHTWTGTMVFRSLLLHLRQNKQHL